MINFEIGDRVQIQSRNGAFTIDTTGTVTSILKDMRIMVAADNNENVTLICCPCCLTQLSRH